MFCSQCGSPMSDTAAFCSSCGAPAEKAQAQASPEQDDSIKPPLAIDSPNQDDVQASPIQFGAPLSQAKDDTQVPPGQLGTISPPVRAVTNVPPVQHDLSEPPKPRLGKGKKILIIAIAAALVLLGGFAAIAGIFFTRDFLIFFMGEERYTRNMFSGVAEGVSGHLLNQLSEAFEDGMDVDIGELTYSLSFNAAPDSVRRLANDFAFFDDDTISNLELIAASSIDFSATYDISGQSPLLNLVASWSLADAGGSAEEILSLESILVDDALYLRIRQLLDSYVGINFDDLGFSLSDLGAFGDFSTIFEQIYVEPFGSAPSDLGRLSDFIDDHEQEINGMISDLAGVFFSFFDDMRVDRNVSVFVGDEAMDLHRAVIATDYEELLRASAATLEVIRDHEGYVSLIFDAMWIADPNFNYTRREFLDSLDRIIENLIDDADRYGAGGEDIDVYLYIDRRNRVVGFGVSPQNDDGYLSFVVVDGTGYDFSASFNDVYVRLHGFLNSGRRATVGDLHVFVRLYDDWQREEIIIEGKLLDFEYASDFLSLSVSGSDILGLIEDNVQMDAQTADLLSSLELYFSTMFSGRESSLDLDIRLLRPEISFAFSGGFMPLDYVLVAAPIDEDVLYIDLPALMDGDMFALLPYLGALMEIYNNLFGIAENLSNMGFEAGRMLEDFLNDIFGGLF